jgi:hypothetical protein
METDLPDGIESHQWFRTRREAVEAARAQHSYEAHPEVHLYGHGGGTEGTMDLLRPVQCAN